MYLFVPLTSLIDVMLLGFYCLLIANYWLQENSITYMSIDFEICSVFNNKLLLRSHLNLHFLQNKNFYIKDLHFAGQTAHT